MTSEFYSAVNEAKKLNYSIEVEEAGYRVIYEGATVFLKENYGSEYFERQDDIETWFEDVNRAYTLYLRNLKLEKIVGPIKDGKLPAYVWPGGYPILYVDTYGDDYCAECAQEDETITGAGVYYGGLPAYCIGCGMEIESAYGDPEESER